MTAFANAFSNFTQCLARAVIIGGPVAVIAFGLSTHAPSAPSWRFSAGGERSAAFRLMMWQSLSQDAQRRDPGEPTTMRAANLD